MFRALSVGYSGPSDPFGGQSVTWRRNFFSLADRFAILARDNFTCQYCGAKAPNVIVEVDHKVPRSLGGSNHPSNGVTACYECNMGKGSRTIEDAAARAEFRRIERPNGDGYSQLDPEGTQCRRVKIASFLSRSGPRARKRFMEALENGLVLGSSCLLSVREYRVIDKSKILTEKDFYK